MSVTVDSKLFREAITRAKHVVSRDRNLPVFGAVLLEVKEDASVTSGVALVITATDRYVLTREVLPCANPRTKEGVALVAPP